MVHRPNKIIADRDNRLVPADAARDSANLRFAASIGNTDLAITLVNGLAQINYDIPSGDNACIGTKEDFETQAVFFALWNSNNNHGIYRILNGTIALVIGGAILDFQEDSDVSIAVIDGKIYWTDDHSQPKMVNIEKGIAGLYPDPLEEWMITQIKRPPGLPLNLSPTQFTLFDASVDYGNEFTNPVPTQFSYYYVYDNDEESRLAPWSPCNWFLTDVVLNIPDVEYNAYLNGLNLIKQIVFVFRNGNDGVVYVARRVNNESPFSGTITISNIRLLTKTAVSTDITDADFDSVPLLSVSNEIAQNRLDHGNYVIDYPNWTGLTLDLTITRLNTAIGTAVTWRTFKCGEYYNVGIELLDEWGRKIGVVSQQTIQIPEAEYTAWQQSPFNNVPPIEDRFSDDRYNRYRIDYEISGTFPDWAKYYRVVYSKALNVNYFNKTLGIVYQWYSKDGVDYFGNSDVFGTGVPGYQYLGTAINLCPGTPFLFATGNNQYARIAPQYYTGGPLDQIVNPVTKNIEKQVNTFVFIKGLNLLYGTYQLELGSMSDSPSEIYWQSTSDVLISTDVLTGFVSGDCYINRFQKTFFGSTTEVLNFIPGTDDVNTPPTIPNTVNTQVVPGVFYSENPTNIWAQNWDSDIGQANVVNENQRQKRILQGIIFSNPLIQGTQINGLSKFNSVDNRQAPLENGPITALVRTNATQREPGVLLAIGKNGVQSFYYDGVQLTNVDGSANVSTTTQYLASQRPLVGNYGAERLRDICVTPLGTVYYWSEGIQDLIRYTNAGLQQLGETYEFMNYLRNQLESSTRFMITYDQVTDEVILVGNNSQAYIFSERYKTFQGARDYYDADGVRPERGANLSTRTFFFKQGQVWQMGPQLSAQPNSFFGDIKNPQLTIITNEAPTVVKRWGRVRVFGPKPLTLDLTSEAPEGGDDDTLVSYIRPGWWMDRKWNFDAAIRTSVTDDGEVLNGKPMESRLLISTFAWDANTFVKLNYIQVDSNIALVQ